MLMCRLDKLLRHGNATELDQSCPVEDFTLWRKAAAVGGGRFDQRTFCCVEDVVEDLTLCQWREAATVGGGRFEENLLWINSCPVKDLPQWREAASVVPALTLCGVHSGEKQLQQWEMVEDLTRELFING